MSQGVFLALLAYGLFSCADALIKSVGDGLSVFQIGFFTALFGVLPAIISKNRSERWRDALQFRHPVLLQMRGMSGVLGSACVIYAFTHVPLADVYSLAFLAPIFVVILSAALLKEAVPRRRWPLLLLSLAGVMIIVRPGFRDLQLGHLAALGCALFTASNTILVRTLAPHEHRLAIFAVVTTYAIALNGVGMLIWGFELPTMQQLATLLAIGMLGGFGHLTFIKATLFVPANHVAPAQYTQMIWAIALGAAFYGEFIDLPAAFGIAILCTAGLINMLSDERVGMLVRRHARASS